MGCNAMTVTRRRGWFRGAFFMSRECFLFREVWQLHFAVAPPE
jgi:hypothetical protein